MKRVITLIFFLVLCLNVKGQGYFAFYELRDLVQQTQSLQPAFISNNSVSVSFPALNFGTNIQADYRLEQLLSKNAQGQFVVDFDVLRESAQEMNYTNLDLTGNLFALNIKTSVGSFSAFGNTRATFDLVYGEPLLEFLANGNTGAIGSSVDLSDTKLMLNGINEYGIGYANEFLNKKLVLGARVKMVQGIAHASLGDDFEGSLHTREEDFLWTISTNNTRINTAGLNLLLDETSSTEDLTSYLISNENRSVAFDFGAKYKVLPFLMLEAAVNDIGNIKWSEEVTNYNLDDGEVTFQGIDLMNSEGNALQDSLLSKFNTSETTESFESPLGTRYYFTASGYITPNDRVSLTYFKNNAFSDLPGNYALSVNHKLDNFIFALVGTYRRANTEINFGASIASNIGPVQLYMALDNFLLLNKPEQYSKANLRFGLNLKFGFKRWQKQKLAELDEL